MSVHAANATPRAATAIVAALLAAVLLVGCSEGSSGPSGPYPGVSLSATSVVTAENGPNVPVEVRLLMEPTSNVTVTVTSTNVAEGMLVKSGGWWGGASVTLTFTPTNWSVAQTIEVVPVDDYVKDGNQAYRIEVRVLADADPLYAKVPLSNLLVTNSDDDMPGFTLDRALLATLEPWSYNTFTVRLNVPPSQAVVVRVRSTDVTEGTLGATDANMSHETVDLLFGPGDWSTPKTVYVHGLGDGVDDGNQTYDVTVSVLAAQTLAAEYLAAAPQAIRVTNTDADTAGITIAGATSTLVTSENGTVETFTVKLNCAPDGDLVVPVTSGRPAEGLLSGAGQSGAAVNLTFTALNWSTPQTVTVVGQDDSVPSDNVEYDVTVGKAVGDAAYAALASQAVHVLNTDNDTPVVIVPAASGSPLQTRESGTVNYASFTVAINRAPIGDLLVPITTSDRTEGRLTDFVVTADTLYVKFTPTDYLNPKTVYVTGMWDGAADGDQPYTITVGTPTGDPAFSSVAPQVIEVTNIDADTAGYAVSASYLYVTEGAAAQTLSVSLNVAPTADVVISVTVDDETEALVAGGDSGSTFVKTLHLTFTPADWSTAQTVQVQGVADHVDDSLQYPKITVGPTESAAGNRFDGLPSQSVSVYVYDVDDSSVVLSRTSGLATTEKGGVATFTVQLTSIPSAPVTIPITVDHPGEAWVGTGGTAAASVDLVIPPEAWNVPQTVYVTGQDDALIDGAQPFALTLETPSGDPKYAQLWSQRVTGSNGDDEVGQPEGTSASPIVLGPAAPRTSQAGTAAPSYYVVSLPAGAPFAVSVANATNAMSATVDDNGNYNSGNLCAESPIPAQWTWRCTGVVPAGGEVHVRISTTAPAGSGFGLYAGTWRTFTSADVPKAIPDITYSPAASTLTITDGPFAVTKVKVRLTVTHPSAGQLTLSLERPSGYPVTLSYGFGGTAPGFADVVFDSDAANSIRNVVGGTEPITGTWAPSSGLGLHTGTPGNGAWKLNVSDTTTGSIGTIESWSVDMY